MRHRQSDFAGSSTICTTKLFLSAVVGLLPVAGDAIVAGVGLSPVASAKADDPGVFPAMDTIAARKSCSRFAGRSTRTLSRP
ncbi:MAG: hypothetical protein DME52_09465 [Verrucomicrobia bacterium]|nr:MAG: hypothetical protein DME52_09465 [Verrucomicrobiota bacterium]